MHQSVTALRASPFLQLLLPGLRDNSTIMQLQAVLIPRQRCWEVWATAGSPFLWELLFSWHSQAWLRPELQHHLCHNRGCAWPGAQVIQTWTETRTDCPASPRTCLITKDLAGSHWEISDLGQHHRTRSCPWFTDLCAQLSPWASTAPFNPTGATGTFQSWYILTVNLLMSKYVCRALGEWVTFTFRHVLCIHSD